MRGKGSRNRQILLLKDETTVGICVDAGGLFVHPKVICTSIHKFTFFQTPVQWNFIVLFAQSCYDCLRCRTVFRVTQAFYQATHHLSAFCSSKSSTLLQMFQKKQTVTQTCTLSTKCKCTQIPDSGKWKKWMKWKSKQQKRQLWRMKHWELRRK